MREELTEGIDHLRMAAAHAAGGAAGYLAPRLDTVRHRLEPTFDKSIDLARDSAKRANRIARKATGKKKEAKMRRWPMVLGGLMVAGAAAGAASALLSRRRRQRWNEYGTTGSMTGSQGARSLSDTARTAASNVAETAKDKASDVLGQIKPTPESPASTTTPQPTRTGEYSAQGEAFRSGTAAGSRNSRP